jgi:predicted RNA-binding Zn-ribbon protein involved in translation (DUF1610 family)
MEMYQDVVITLSDGTVAVYTGKAVCFSGETRFIDKIQFTEPKALPPDHYFEIMTLDVVPVNPKMERVEIDLQCDNCGHRAPGKTWLLRELGGQSLWKCPSCGRITDDDHRYVGNMNRECTGDRKEAPGDQPFPSDTGDDKG